MMTFSVPSSPRTMHHQVVQLSARQKNVPTLFYCTCRRHSIHIYYRNILPISLNVVREGSSWKSGSMAWLKFLQEKASRKHSEHMLKNAHFFLTSCNKLAWRACWKCSLHIDQHVTCILKERKFLPIPQGYAFAWHAGIKTKQTTK